MLNTSNLHFKNKKNRTIYFITLFFLSNKLISVNETFLIAKNKTLPSHEKLTLTIVI